jgi:hypothetical protein
VCGLYVWVGKVGGGLSPHSSSTPMHIFTLFVKKNMSLDVFVCFKWFNKERVDKANGEANDC